MLANKLINPWTARTISRARLGSYLAGFTGVNVSEYSNSVVSHSGLDPESRVRKFYTYLSRELWIPARGPE